MSHAELSLTYGGPAVENGLMDVRDLAPALLAVGNLVSAANRVVNGETANARVKVRTVSPGSFNIGLDVGISFLGAIRDILAGPEATAAANLIAILTGTGSVGVGAIALVRWLQGKRPAAVRRTAPGRVMVTIDDQEIEVDEIVARVSVDVGVRLALERVVAEPLAKDGIDSVELGQDAKRERIEKSDAFYFLAPPDSEGGGYAYRFRAPFSIVSLSFKEGNKWKLFDGKSTINVVVRDVDFVAKVNRNEVAFAKGDLLICDVLVEADQQDQKLRSEYFVERVVEHRRSIAQGSLFDHPSFSSDADGKLPGQQVD